MATDAPTRSGMPTRDPAKASLLGARSLWIGGASQDLLLLIGPPLFIVPLIALARTQWSDVAIALFITTFGAKAHHLPGMIRAYGDPQFFDRYRIRLVIAPIAIVTVCLTFAYLDLRGLLLITILWGVWHALAQVYGLGRMYDAKVGLISGETARLDKAVCLGWFVGGFLFSPNRMITALGGLYKCGFPSVDPSIIMALQVSWAAFTLAVTVRWSWNQISSYRTNLEGNPIKVVLFVSSFSFWWYTQVPVENIILGAALFEAFHDIQYLTTVWIYNRKLVSKNERLGRSLRFLFRPGAQFIAMYVGLCWLYGIAGPVANLAISTEIVEAFLLTSLILHFYFDSFLWNVRERSIRDDLDLGTGPEPVGPTSFRGRIESLPGIGWAWFVIPLAGLVALQWQGPSSDLDSIQALARSLPKNERILLGLGDALTEAGRIEDSLAPIRTAAEIHPDSLEAQARLLEITTRLGRSQEAKAAFDRLVALGGEDSGSHVQMGLVNHRASPMVARDHYRRALALDPESFEAHVNLASLLTDRGDRENARAHLLQAVRIAPTNAAVLYNLGLINLQTGRREAARKAFEELVRIHPDHAEARRELLSIKRSQNEREGANR